MSLKAVSPHALFKQQMTQRRRQYQLEIQKLSQSKEMAELKEADAISRTQELRMKRLDGYKQQRMAFINGMDSLVPINTGSTVDHITGSTRSTVDGITRSTVSQWKQYVQMRRARRSTNWNAFNQSQSRKRLDALTFLFHSAADFVTYTNLEAKLSQAVRPAASTPRNVIPRLLTAIQKQQAAPPSDSENETLAGMMESMPKSVESASGWLSDASMRKVTPPPSTREAALEAIITGSSNNLDSEAIKFKARSLNLNGPK